MKNIIEFNIDLIIEEYSNYVFKIVDNIIGPSLPYQDKEEIVSDAFYLLWKNQTKIESNLKSYLGAIARHCAYDKLRKKSIIFDCDERAFLDISTDLENLIFIKEQIGKLNNKEKTLFELYYLGGLKIKEIANLQSTSIPNIKIQLFRLRKKLKEEIHHE